MTREPKVPEGDEEAAAGLSLRIPRARFVAKDGNESRVGTLVTPLYAKRNGLHLPGRGFFLCMECGGELESRFEGFLVSPYFAHWRGKAVDCELKEAGESGYKSYESKPWKDGLRTRNRNLGLHLRLVPRARDALLTGHGATLSSDEYHAISGRQHELSSAGIDGTFGIAQLAWSRPNFDAKVTNPFSVSVTLKHPAGRVLWTPTLTPQERQWGCIPLAGVPGAPLMHAADVQPGSDTWWIVHRDAPDLQARLRALDPRLDFRALERLPVSGSSEWKASKLPWDWASGRPRHLLKALGIRPERIGRPFRLIPLTGSFQTSGEVTVVEIEGNHVRAMVTPEIFAGLQVEVIPLPYDPDKVIRKALTEEGALVNFELETREKSSDCYLLALDPQDNHRFLSQHRVTILRQESSAATESSAIRLGLHVALDGKTHFLSPTGPDRELVLDLSNLAELVACTPPAIELVSPPYADGEASVPPVAVRAYRRESPTVPHLQQEVRDAETFGRVISLIATDPDLRTVAISFGALGDVRIKHREASILEKRHALRMRLAGRIMREFAGLRRLPTKLADELLAEATREGDTEFPWLVDFENVYAIARKYENRRAEGMEAMLDYLFTESEPKRSEGPA